MLIVLACLCFFMTFRMGSSVPEPSILPLCDPDLANFSKPTFSVFTHDSSYNKFYGNPGSGALDAATLLGVEINWNHRSGGRTQMVHDIHEAVDNGVDGIITTIPDDEVYEAVKYAKSKGVPVVVYDTGEHYSYQLGLTRVLQSDWDVGVMVAQQLIKDGYNKPLAISHIENLVNETYARLDAITKTLHPNGSQVTLLRPTDSSSTTLKRVQEYFLSGQFDSLVSLGGMTSSDLVINTAITINSQQPQRRFDTILIDFGGQNMTTLFETRPQSTFAIDQLPYYQAALPLFYIYLEAITGHSIFGNQTISTGPYLVTSETVKRFIGYIEKRPLTVKSDISTVGALIPNAEGDTYGRNVLAGMNQLSNKLGWTIIDAIQNDFIGYPPSILSAFNDLINHNNTPIVLVGNDDSVLRQVVNSAASKNISLAALGLDYVGHLNTTYPKSTVQINIDFEYLSRSAAQNAIADGIMAPICFSERRVMVDNYLCNMLYQQYKDLSLSPIPAENEMVHLINVDSQGSVGRQLSVILDDLHRQNRTVDGIFTFSEYIFDSVNMRYLQNYTPSRVSLYSAADRFDEKQALIDLRLNTSWSLNTFAVGFLTVLDLFISETLDELPWENTQVRPYLLTHICPPGTYYLALARSSYCLDKSGLARSSIQCRPCPFNHYSAMEDQNECLPCQNGTIANMDSTSCISCYDPDAVKSTLCATYIQHEKYRRTRKILSIVLPIVLVLLLVLFAWLCYYLRKRFKEHKDGLDPGEEDSWLLSYDSLTRKPRPSMENERTDDQYDTQLLTTEIPSRGHSPTSTPLLSKSHNATVDNTDLIGDSINNNNNCNVSDTYHLANIINQQYNDKFEEQSVKTPDTETNSAHWAMGYEKSINLDLDEHSRMQTGSPTIKQMHNSIGRHRNLLVCIKQIGFKSLRLDEDMKREIAILKQQRHHNLVEFIGVCIESHGTYIVEEYCRKGPLDKILENPDIDLTWIFRCSLINDLLKGIHFIHQSKIETHGLLTTASCIITGRWELKVTDYGLQKMHQVQYDSSVTNFIQKQYPDLPSIIIPHKNILLWLAPESVVNLSTDLKITFPSKKADIYSVGVVMNQILSRTEPYNELAKEGGGPDDIFHQIIHEHITPILADNDRDGYYYQVNRLITRCWAVDPDDRPQTSDLIKHMKAIDPSMASSENVVDNLASLLETYANDMENLVYNRTANLQERTLELEEERGRTQNLLKDLKKSKEAAEAAAAAKQNFLANMSHEIRTPMNAVIGMSRILMESDLPAELYDCAETIESSGNHLMAIIDDILDYSKIESGKLTLEQNSLDLTFVMESAVKLVASNYMQKDIALWIEIDPKVPIKIIGDLIRLRQIILNFLSNSFKFTDSGGNVHVHVEVGASSLPKLIIPDNRDGNLPNGDENNESATSYHHLDGDFVPIKVSVSDTGIGIPEDKIETLFQSFSQVDASITRNFGGTGLGLSISRKLCRLMHGDVWLTSKYGEGTTFTFQVMLQKQPNTCTYGEQHKLAELTKTCSGTMVITEKSHNQKAWRSILGNAGFKFIQVLAFAEADQYFNQGSNQAKPNLLIVDVDFMDLEKLDMGITSSDDAVTYLRKQHPRLATIPTLCVNDIRLKRSQENNTTTESPLLVTHNELVSEPTDTPTTVDPFQNHHICQIPAIITKPFKNSTLFSVLHQMTDPRSDTDTLMAPIPTNNAYQHHRHQRLSFTSSNESNRRRSSANKSTDDSYNDRKFSTTSSNISQTSTLAPSYVSPCSSPTDRNRSTDDSLANINALLVDDNPVNQKVLSRMLGRMGLSCKVANDGKEACDIIRNARTSDPIDLVFMDIWMPRMNGLEASHIIRQELSDSSLKPYIIAMTACVMSGDREKCIEVGMNDYVSKPVRKEELEAAIHTYTQTLAMLQPDQQWQDQPDRQETPTNDLT
ncbi:hypothetical protein BC941DRAFT_429688 [Chlamydoabsidia padenii]|nr:hypothetical protein BC941DRAFT_429688 [Chlamydoabsidia padenii]